MACIYSCAFCTIYLLLFFFFNRYHTVWIIIVLSYGLKSGKPSAVYFFLKIALIKQVLLWFIRFFCDFIKNFSLFYYYEKYSWNVDKDCFEYYRNFKNTDSSNPWAQNTFAPMFAFYSLNSVLYLYPVCFFFFSPLGTLFYFFDEIVNGTISQFLFVNFLLVYENITYFCLLS